MVPQDVVQNIKNELEHFHEIQFSPKLFKSVFVFSVTPLQKLNEQLRGV